jgi:hypothetical protein
VAQICDGFSASVIYGLESYGFCKEGEALDFIEDGLIELDGELPLNLTPLAAASARDASTASGTSSKVPYRPRAAPARVRSRTPTCRSSAPAPRS